MQAGLYTYAWDLEAEGYDQTLDAIANAGFTAVNLATSYHAGKFLLPHNPQRRIHFAEDGSLYFQPDLAKYGRIHPRVNSLVSADGDPVGQVVRGTAERGMTYVAWVVLMHNSWLGERYPDATMHTAFGDPLIHSLCPAHPDVRAYAVAMIRDLVNRYDVAAIELESPGYMGFLHGYHHEIIGVDLDPVQQALLSISFNPAEISGAAAEGIDAEGLRRRVIGLLDACWNEGVPVTRADGPTEAARALLDDPELAAYRAWQAAQVVSLSSAIRDAINEVSGSTQIRQFAGGPVSEEDSDSQVPLLATADQVLAGYSSSDEDARHRASAARALGKPVWGMVRALHPDATSTEAVQARIAAWSDGGVDGINVYNFGLMTSPMFAAVSEALRR